MEDFDVAEVVKCYVSLRNERDTARVVYEEQEARFKDGLDKLKAVLLSQCNALNVESLKTTAGTVIKQTKERFYTQDWDGFYKFVLETQLPQLLEKRIAQGNFKQYMIENPSDGLPPGVSVFREFDVVVRKPNS